jgi:hypothetical protein
LTEQQRQIGDVGGVRARQASFIAKAKELVNKAGDDLEEYAGEMGTDILRFREDAHRLVATLTELLVLQNDLAITAERQAEDRKALAAFVNLLTDSREGITSFQAAVAGMPPLTGHFKRARKNVTAMLGEFLAEVQSLISESRRILNEMGDDPSGCACEGPSASLGALGRLHLSAQLNS